ncbi:MAG: domain S-box/diguanylate cyclase protein [Frankiales bacterium]|nr:domain S-box/diguanylate cyclase protein [Frankiales bacterium]
MISLGEQLSAPLTQSSGRRLGTATGGLLRAVLDALPDATAVLDADGVIVGVNRAWRMFTLDNGGDPDTTGHGVNYLDVCARAAAAGCSQASTVGTGLTAVLDGRTAHFEDEYPCPSPEINRWFLLRITPVGDGYSGAVVSHVNISRRKMAEDELAHTASHDPLTGLANRTLFMRRLAASLAPRPGRSTPDVGLLYIDLDRFKPVNDRFGHDAGDEVLLTVAHRLAGVLRDQDTIARLGGDEFAVLVPRAEAAQLATLITRMTGCLDRPYRVHGQQLHLSASIGSHLAVAGDDPVTSLRAADLAMYQVKHLSHGGPLSEATAATG